MALMVISFSAPWAFVMTTAKPEKVRAHNLLSVPNRYNLGHRNNQLDCQRRFSHAISGDFLNLLQLVQYLVQEYRIDPPENNWYSSFSQQDQRIGMHFKPAIYP